MENLLSHQYFKSENKTEMYSDVFTVILPSVHNTNITEPVNFTIQHKQKVPEAGIMTCVFWEDKRKNKEEQQKDNGGKEGEALRWSVEGCWVAYSDENYSVQLLSPLYLCPHHADWGASTRGTFLRVAEPGVCDYRTILLCTGHPHLPPV
ncbi:uncharacterized protein LOC130185834 [Seriola aureovittata]|uniref:uncharacterized protein LOC130185834 n=1 Tax=Seriola aureovittata TaxID=2871759 RepID=UPI0024BE96AE|nr:uncharacterized protein LOC130185834 [Seriola aureovittata]